MGRFRGLCVKYDIRKTFIANHLCSNTVDLPLSVDVQSTWLFCLISSLIDSGMSIPGAHHHKLLIHFISLLLIDRTNIRRIDKKSDT